MKLVAIALAALAPLAAAQCDQEYECEYRTPDVLGVFYDLKPLCMHGMSYTFVNDTTDVVYRFNVCGSATVDCIPPYPVEFQKGVAIQFFGEDPAPNATCTTKTGDKVPCTKDCEVLAVGVPIITLIDPSEPFLGVNVTHRGVPSLPQDLFRCPEDPTTGATKERQVTFQISCNHKHITAPVTTSAYEVSPCEYIITMESAHGCGCIPYCYGKNCGDDGCGGLCGPIEYAGACPDPNAVCTDQGACCVPDCNGRQCGPDGCGGQCGDCPAGQECTKYQVCYDPAVPPTPRPSNLPTETVYTTTGSDMFAAYLGGIITAGFVGLTVSYVSRYRAGR